jgi:hypothetical protein
MKEVVGSLNEDTVVRTCTCFRSRIGTMVKADGDFIELNYSQYVVLLHFCTSIKSDIPGGPFLAIAASPDSRLGHTLETINPRSKRTLRITESMAPPLPPGYVETSWRLRRWRNS